VCLEFFLCGAFVLTFSSNKCLWWAAALMEKYRNVSIDFADAILMTSGEERGTEWLFTLGRRGFSAHQLCGKRHFSVVRERSL